MGVGPCCSFLEPCFKPVKARGRGVGGQRGAREYDAPVGTRPARSVGGRPPQVTGRKRALLIGINYVGTQAALQGCHNDVKRMKDLLRRLYGFRSSDMRVMMDLQGSEMPTRAAVLAGARWLVEGARPGDCLFFHYSGHGAQQEDPRGAEEDAMDETILPSDFQSAGQIIDDELFEILCAKLPSGVKMTAVMDCCHSGTGLDLPFNCDMYSNTWVEDTNPCHSEGDVQLFSGCTDDQTSADVRSMYSQPSGAMTSAFCDAIEQNSAPKYTQLLSTLHRLLDQRGHWQRPQLTSSQRFDLSGRTFEVCGGINANTNQVIGRHFRKRKLPKRGWNLADDDPLGDMLTGMIIGDLLFDGVGMFGGGMFDAGPFDAGYGDPGWGGGGMFDGPGGGMFDGGFDGGFGGFDGGFDGGFGGDF